MSCLFFSIAFKLSGRLYFTSKVVFFLWEWKLQGGCRCILFSAVTLMAPGSGAGRLLAPAAPWMFVEQCPAPLRHGSPSREQNRPLSFIPIVLLIYGFVVQSSTSSRNLSVRCFWNSRAPVLSQDNVCVTASAPALFLCWKGTSVERWCFQ